MKQFHALMALVLTASVTSAALAEHHESLELPGTWNVTASTESGNRELTWTIKRDAGKLSGISVDPENQSERRLDRITVEKDSVVIEVDIEQDGRRGVIRITAKETSPGTLTGDWIIVGDDGTEYMNGQLTAVKEVKFSGVWEATAVLPDGNTLESVVRVSGPNSALRAIVEGDNGQLDVRTATASGSSLKLEFEFEMNGNPIDCVIAADASGNNQLKGKWIVLDANGDEAAEGEWSAKRQDTGFAGTWDVVATVPDGVDYTGTLVLKAPAGKYTGTSQASDGPVVDLQTVTAEGQTLQFSLPVQHEGFVGTVKVVARTQADGSLVGEWITSGDDGGEVMRDEWRATRR